MPFRSEIIAIFHSHNHDRHCAGLLRIMSLPAQSSFYKGSFPSRIHRLFLSAASLQIQPTICNRFSCMYPSHILSLPFRSFSSTISINSVFSFIIS
eukprot:Gb_40433 [translate_table: standard]